MKTPAPALVGRAKTAGQLLGALPAFLLMLMIPLLIAANIACLSLWLYETKHDVIGMICFVTAAILAGVAAISAAWFLVMWLCTLAQAARGKFSFSEPTHEQEGASDGDTC